jgi:hypothetical protein
LRAVDRYRIGSTASVIWVLNFGGLKWMLLAGACVASFISSVALAEEFVEWHRHSEASPVQRQLLPPASWEEALLSMDKLLFWLGIGAAQKGAGSKEVKPGRHPVISFVVGILIAVLIAAGAFVLLVSQRWSEHYEEFIGAKKHLVLGVLSHTGPLQWSTGFANG